ncbi:protein translocase subunit SecD [Pontimonas sp.]|uniref:protein translocase subunit SecD n=1 Tax=Pontimonas sp. TaxID=2304492 RepID=UPI0028701D40|nr:protein translocase subunit SecD [Pontimonas sp.]MDR9396442.1 protein translocase subunit SecD [Pontimonas sp.]
MAKRSVARQAARSLIWLGVIFALLVGGNALAVFGQAGSWVPKLALDLQGGTQIILEPRLAENQSVSEEQLNQAVSIIRQRVDSSGVAEAEVTTQGGENIVVGIPGEPDQATLERIRSSAKLEFRPVLIAGAANTEPVEPVEAPESPDDQERVEPTSASDLAWITPEIDAEYQSINCFELDTSGANVADPNLPLVTCSQDGFERFILGPVEVGGESIADASSGLIAGPNGAPTNDYGVFIEFDSEGTAGFREVTERLITLPGVQNQFAIVLDGRVISAPRTLAAITDGNPQISGNFTQESAAILADQLKFGALPIGFQVQSSETISATLGVSQLQSGLIAALIGLILVVLYSLFQYRLLGLVTVFSLTTAFVLSYFVITYLSNAQGYRLSLAGVAGLIVAIGITADSFIVFFERIRDELRDGRMLESAIQAAWKRAFRTILASDAVSFIAAVTLYLLAVGNVRGFAFTLGVTTVVDLIIVALFTHPVMQLLGRTRFFASGHPLSGLDPQALGAVYRGRARFREPVAVDKTARERSRGEAKRRQTIAERKAAEAEAADRGAGRIT